MVSTSQAEDPGNEIDIVCGALSAKLLTRNLSRGTSRCVSFEVKLFTPCEFEHLAGRSSSKN